MREAGVPLEVTVWYGICAPSGVPKPILAKLNADLHRVIGAPDTQRRLIELGVDPKVPVSTGENALHGAAYRGWNSVVQLLAEHGTDVNAISKSGTTPWRAAAGEGDRLGGVLFNLDTAALLVKLGADPTLGKPCMAQTRCR